jgi:hypothetical protein
LLKYTDLPESTELHRAIQCLRDMNCQEENPFTCRSINPGCPVCSTLQRVRFFGPPARLLCRYAGFLLVLIPAGTLLRFPAIPNCFDRLFLRILTLAQNPKWSDFSVQWKKKISLLRFLESRHSNV